MRLTATGLMCSVLLAACSGSSPAPEVDAGQTDAGQTVDAGHGADAGGSGQGTDAGETVDAGTHADAGSDQDGGSAPSTFAAVNAIFQLHCTNCHSGDSPQGNLDLSTTSIAYAQLVNQLSTGSLCSQKPHTRVIPGDPTHSLLYQKVTGTFDCGLFMPQGPESGPARVHPLTDTEKQTIYNWIEGGAMESP